MRASRLSNINHPWMLVARSLPRKVSNPSSRALVPIFSVVSLALVSYQSTTKSSFSCSARPSRVDLDRSSSKYGYKPDSVNATLAKCEGSRQDAHGQCAADGSQIAAIYSWAAFLHVLS